MHLSRCYLDDLGVDILGAMESSHRHPMLTVAHVVTSVQLEDSDCRENAVAPEGLIDTAPAVLQVTPQWQETLAELLNVRFASDDSVDIDGTHTDVSFALYPYRLEAPVPEIANLQIVVLV